MAIKKNKQANSVKKLTNNKPQKHLVKGKNSKAGRCNNGRISVRFRGGGHKRKLRKIDFNRNKFGVDAIVKNIEYDPNRSARIALIQYLDGEKHYILAPSELKIGDHVSSGKKSDIKIGNHLKIQDIPLGSAIHNIELRKGKGSQLVRAAGSVAQLIAKKGKYAQIKLPSSEIRKVQINCFATLGQVGNIKHELIKMKKAGQKRWLGRRPHNRGVSMNPIDHPLGGGEGKSSGGRHPVSPWGKATKGHRTRNNKRTEPMIIKRRK
jgi:large subunit ribosomal protein L2